MTDDGSYDCDRCGQRVGPGPEWKFSAGGREYSLCDGCAGSLHRWWNEEPKNWTIKMGLPALSLCGGE